jgi:hypothetical protein
MEELYFRIINVFNKILFENKLHKKYKELLKKTTRMHILASVQMSLPSDSKIFTKKFIKID